MDTIIHGDCLEVAKNFANESINLVVTSPPYAEQRSKQYGGIAEADYPQWTVDWCNAFRHALTKDGSIAIVIRPHIKNGQISDYVLRTRLALRATGFNESEELIWIKGNSPPLGSLKRPRRAWESILWFSKTNRPFCDPLTNGTPSNRVGFEGTKGVGDWKAGCHKAREGTARCKDYVEVGTSGVDRSPENTHPAQYPADLAAWIVKLLCPVDGVVVDPFVGSGTTLVACAELNHCGYNLTYHGIEIREDYCEIAKARLGGIS